MRAEPTVVGEPDRPGATDHGVLAAIVFAVVSLLLIATLPLASGRSATNAPQQASPVAASRGGR
jgi:hypothetical protein